MNNDPLKSDVNDALLTCMADVPEEEVPQWEERGMNRLKELALSHGAEQVVRCVADSDHDNSFEMYWLARTGITEVRPYLINFLDSEDEDARSSAINGLLHLNDDRGWEELELLISSTPTGSYNEPLPWYFEMDLELIGTERALQLLEKMKEKTT